MSESFRFRASLIAAAFLALHLPFLPASLEDLDSINFALGVRDFDVGRHQPHPPGYPVFIGLAKAMHSIVSSEVRALALLGLFAAALAVFALARLFKAFADREGGFAGDFWLGVVLAVASPLFWVTATRPLSDMVGLAAALAVQATALTARTRGALAATSLCAGIGAGIRSQVIWLAVPVLLLALLRMPAAERIRTGLAMAGGYSLGILIWAVPLVVFSGGPAAYAQALFSQGTEDFTGVVMLWTTPTVRQLARALEQTFVSPWGFVPGAVAVLAFAAIGTGLLAIRSPRVLAWLAVAYGPYLIFHLLFQETATTRYALPLVVPVAYAAMKGLSIGPRQATAAGVLAFAAFNVFVGTQAIYANSQIKAPAFQMIDTMQGSLRAAAPVLGMHRRDEFDLRRPFLWERLPPVERRLPSPPKHEWLEVVKYWNSGGRQPVWFVADPPRSDMALFRRQRSPARFRWPFDLPGVMGGVRPNEMDWYILEPPDWYLGEGWAVTPETAGVAREDGRGPSRGGSQGWIRRWLTPATLMIGGRHLGPSGSSRITVLVDDHAIDEATVTPGFFLRMLTLPAGSLAGDGDYATVTIKSDSEHIAIEQFDAQPEGQLVFGYGEGWNELEYNPATGRLWRWSSERAAIRARTNGRSLAIRMDGELEEANSSRVTIRAGDRIIAEQEVDRLFSLSASVPAEFLSEPETLLTVETSAWYIPAEVRWRSRDQRHLGLKIHSLQLVPAF